MFHWLIWDNSCTEQIWVSEFFLYFYFLFGLFSFDAFRDFFVFGNQQQVWVIKTSNLRNKPSLKTETSHKSLSQSVLACLIYVFIYCLWIKASLCSLSHTGPLSSNTGWRTFPRRAARAFSDLATRHASHSNRRPGRRAGWGGVGGRSRALSLNLTAQECGSWERRSRGCPPPLLAARGPVSAAISIKPSRLQMEARGAAGLALLLSHGGGLKSPHTLTARAVRTFIFAVFT